MEGRKTDFIRLFLFVCVYNGTDQAVLRYFILTSCSDISYVVMFGACIEGVVLRDK